MKEYRAEVLYKATNEVEEVKIKAKSSEEGLRMIADMKNLKIIGDIRR